MLIGCFAGFIITIEKLVLILGSLIFSVVILIFLKKIKSSTKTKISLIYGHLIFLLFPFFVLTTDVACGAMCMPCFNNIGNLIVYALPITILFSTIAGFIIIPMLYTFSRRMIRMENLNIINFVKKYSRKFDLKTPKLYIINNAKPIAFSFRSLKSAIFLSAGLIDIFNRKEIEAVLLHELYHLKKRDSLLKISFSLLRLFSPISILARFHHDSNKEEERADSFAIRTQKTDKYIKSAKKKINEFEKKDFEVFKHYNK